MIPAVPRGMYILYCHLDFDFFSSLQFYSSLQLSFLVLEFSHIHNWWTVSHFNLIFRFDFTFSVKHETQELSVVGH